MTSGTSVRLDVAFPSAGDECRGWLFMPDAERPPLVILGHGLGATREFGLEPYARRFADAGVPAVVIPLVGPHGSAALMTSPDSEPGYRALIPPGVHFENGVSARFINHVGLYRPGRSARKVTAPILFCICDKDAVAPAQTALRYAATAPRGEVKRYPVGHFDIYLGEPFEHAVRDQTEFLVRHLELV